MINLAQLQLLKDLRNDILEQHQTVPTFSILRKELEGWVNALSMIINQIEEGTAVPPVPEEGYNRNGRCF